MSPTLFRKATVLGSVALCGLLPLTACSSDETSTAAASNIDTAAVIVEGIPTLDTLYEGTSGTPPTDGPPAATDKSVWFISCGEQSSGCAAVTKAANEAAQTLGWDFHVADGNLGIADGYTSATRTALAANPDAIIVDGWSCDDGQQALQEAKTQGVPVIGLDNTDCSDVTGGGPELFSVPMIYTESIPDNASRWVEYGRLAADYIINRSGGTAQIINNPGTDTLGLKVDEGFTQELAKCPGCAIVDTVQAADEAVTPDGPWIQSLRASLVRNPNANAVFFPWDFLMSSVGGARAVKESGLDVVSFGGLGSQDGLDLVRAGDVNAITGGRDAGWTAWSAFDQLNRAFNNQPSVAQGAGWILIDQDHNMPAQGTDYVSPVDYKGTYRTSWGK